MSNKGFNKAEYPAGTLVVVTEPKPINEAWVGRVVGFYEKQYWIAPFDKNGGLEAAAYAYPVDQVWRMTK